MLLLLARLGLRAGDVAQLRLTDIEWETGTLRVCGKSRYQVRLPLPQEVGEAILAYLDAGLPPAGAITSSCAASPRTGHCRRRRRLLGGEARHEAGGYRAPVKGAHVLRHTAATQMLRRGVPLEQIGLVLRHRGIDTTAYYAKADVDLLKQIAQPWPEALSC